jgi:hypothetical protein
MDAPSSSTVFQAIALLMQSPLEDEVADDLSGEQETLQGEQTADDDDEELEAGAEVDDDAEVDDGSIPERTDLNRALIDVLGSVVDERDGPDPSLVDISNYQSRLLEVSKAVSERTAYEYEM